VDPKIKTGDNIKAISFFQNYNFRLQTKINRGLCFYVGIGVGNTTQGERWNSRKK
jgi:hypothetical protein